MTNERKDELGKLFLFSNNIEENDLKDVKTQEIAFLICSIEYFKKENLLQNYDYDIRLEFFRKVLTEKIKDSLEIYIAYDKSTKYPYIDFEGRVWIFSEKEYADAAIDYFSKQRVFLEMKKVTRNQFVNEFKLLHYIGVEKSVIDNGQYTAVINRNDILPPPDYTGVEKINIPITNPKLQFAMINFFQTLYSKHNFEGKALRMKELENKMLEEILNAKYLVPIRVVQNKAQIPEKDVVKSIKKGGKVSYALVKDGNELAWLPAFTDWDEFHKSFNRKEWQSNVCSYEDIIAIASKMEGAVVNCSGLPLKLNEVNIKKVDEYIRQKSIIQDSIEKHQSLNIDNTMKQDESTDCFEEIASTDIDSSEENIKNNEIEVNGDGEQGVPWFNKLVNKIKN